MSVTLNLFSPKELLILHELPIFKKSITEATVPFVATFATRALNDTVDAKDANSITLKPLEGVVQ